jgi:hypothetical protein
VTDVADRDENRIGDAFHASILKFEKGVFDNAHNGEELESEPGITSTVQEFP